MTITSGDIKLLRAEVSLDTVDGGGAITAQEVVDGVSNNLFPDISELDRAYGRISLRKLFPAVQTATVDSYYGAHVILTKLPSDPKVNISLFTTSDWTDRRANAQNNIESYLARGPKWAGHLLETQLVGQRAIQLALQANDPTPVVGQGLALVQYEGLANEYSQFVRVSKITEVTQSFVIQNGNVSRRVVTIELSDPLRYEFKGISVYQAYQGAAPLGVCRDTRVADAATYFGASRLAVSTAIGAAQIQAESIFTALVPAAQSETPMVDLAPTGQSALYVPGNTSPITVSVLTSTATGSNVYLGSPILPNSLSFTLFGESVVDGGGILKAGSTQIGTIEYDKGLLRFNASAPVGTGTVVYTFTPAAAPAQVSLSAYTEINQTSRSFNYVETFTPSPSPGSMVVSYIAQGKVYYLYDNGIGQVIGADSSFGTGTLNYGTGTLLLTLGVLPDVGTEILYQWGSGSSDVFTRSGNTVQALQMVLQSANGQISPSSATVTWSVGGVSKTAVDDGAGGLTGDATGTVNYALGLVTLKPTILPAVGTIFTLAVSHGTQLSFSETVASGGAGTHSYVLSGSDPILHRTVSIGLSINNGATYKAVRLVDVPTSGDDGNLVFQGTSTVAGTIQYATRTITFTNPTLTLMQSVKHTKSRKWWKFAGAETWYSIDSVNYTFQGGAVNTSYRTGTALTTTSETFTATALVTDVTDGLSESIVSGSLRLVVGSKTYVDRLGLLYHSIDSTTNAGTFAGSIQLGTGQVSLTDWTSGITNAVTLQALATRVGVQQLSVLAFRAPIVPLRPGSLQLLGTFSAGGTFNVSADSSGNITSTYVNGRVDTVTGMVTVEFGQRYVINSGNRAAIEASDWYDISLEYNDGGTQKVFEPKFVQADTLTFNAVGFTYLPLSASILGLDPVRLPSDGRVPIYRAGSVVVVNCTKQIQFVTATADEVLNVGETRLSTLKVVDSAGSLVDVAEYTVDLDAGIVTLSSGFSNAGLTLPLIAEYRIEDLALVTDVQINGALSLNRPLTHAYPEFDTLVSSALIIGDMQAHQSNLFSQASWSNEFKDSRVGSPIPAQYNAPIYPIVVTNKGSIQERWALVFTSNNAYRIIGETVGQIGTGDINADISPTNPATGSPYFTILSLGWGSGWVAGNTLRFNTTAANFPIWAARTVLQGPAASVDDKFTIQVRGDIDRP